VLMPKPLPAKLRVGLRGAEDADTRTVWPSLKIRVELLEEWHAQCVDPMGCRLPVFWIKSGGAWYRLGRPLEEYRSFLLQESLWLLATYRCALYLTQCPRATFDDALAVIGGRNWLRSATGGPGSYPGAQCRYCVHTCICMCTHTYTHIYLHTSPRSATRHARKGRICCEGAIKCMYAYTQTRTHIPTFTGFSPFRDTPCKKRQNML
jgi:hypothetical protein